MVGPGRLELPTSRLSGVRSNHLSYGPKAFALTELSMPTLRCHIQTFSKPELSSSELAGIPDAVDQPTHSQREQIKVDRTTSVACEERETKAASVPQIAA